MNKAVKGATAIERLENKLKKFSEQVEIFGQRLEFIGTDVADHGQLITKLEKAGKHELEGVKNSILNTIESAKRDLKEANKELEQEQANNILTMALTTQLGPIESLKQALIMIRDSRATMSNGDKTAFDQEKVSVTVKKY